MEFKRFLGNFAKTYLAIGALSVSAFAGADDYHYQGNNGCAPACAPACNTCCGTPCNAPPVCAWGYNPCAYCKCGSPSCCDSVLDSMSVRFDFLWWRASEQGLTLGVEEELVTFENNQYPIRDTVVNRSRIKNPDFKYDAGFRLGLGHNCCDSWDLALNWTHFHTKANASGESHRDRDGNPDTEFFPCWERINGVNPEEVSSRYTLNLDLLDLEFGYKYYVNNSFTLRPYFGLRGARIDQNYRVVARSTHGDSETTINENWISEVKARNDLLAIGPRLGLNIEVNLGCGLKLFGDAAGSIVFGKFDRHAKEFHHDFATTSDPIVNEVDYYAKSSQDRESRSIADLAIGFKWDHCYEFCNRLHPVSIVFAWEHHAFYDFNNFVFKSGGFDLEDSDFNRTCAVNHGDLYTQGLTVSANFGF